MFDAFKIFRKELEVIRREVGRFKSGTFHAGKESKFKITASVQGTNAQVLQTMPDGARINATYTLRTSTELKTAVVGGGTPDVVLIDGKRFLVVRVTPNQNLQHTKHYQVVVTMEHENAD